MDSFMMLTVRNNARTFIIPVYVNLNSLFFFSACLFDEHVMAVVKRFAVSWKIKTPELNRARLFATGDWRLGE